MTKKVNIKKPKNPVISKDSEINAKEMKKRLTFDMPSALHTKLKIYSVKSNKTMSEILNEMLEEKLKT